MTTGAIPVPNTMVQETLGNLSESETSGADVAAAKKTRAPKKSATKSKATAEELPAETPLVGVCGTLPPGVSTPAEETVVVPKRKRVTAAPVVERVPVPVAESSETTQETAKPKKAARSKAQKVSQETDASVSASTDASASASSESDGSSESSPETKTTKAKSSKAKKEKKSSAESSSEKNEAVDMVVTPVNPTLSVPWDGCSDDASREAAAKTLVKALNDMRKRFCAVDCFVLTPASQDSETGITFGEFAVLEHRLACWKRTQKKSQ